MLNLQKTNTQKGLSLIELMVVLIVSSIILVGVLMAVGNVLNESANNLQKQRLNYELQNVLKIITQDVRRAGYWLHAKNDVNTGANSNLYMAADTDINIVGSSCILLGYDIDSDGALPTVNSSADDERYGFRIANNAIQGRIVTSNYSCTTPTGWINITDPNLLQVTNLTFTAQNKAIDFDEDATTLATIDKRKIDVSITANLKQHPNVSLTLNKMIYVYNSKYTP